MESGFAHLLTDQSEWLKAKVRKEQLEAQKQGLARTTSDDWLPSPTTPKSPFPGDKMRGDSVTHGMDLTPLATLSPSTTVNSLHAHKAKDPEDILLAARHEIRQGRKHLREVPYLLPSDLAEMHRQSLRTMLGAAVFSKPFCSPCIEKRPPRRVLELGCGSAFWSATCHEYFARRGFPDASFTGIDIAALAPDLSDQGVRWNFVQHDLRRMPWPFADEDFDFIMIKDMSLAVPIGSAQAVQDECLRILKPRGQLEIWESDHVLRCLMPHERPQAVNMEDSEDVTSTQTRTYPITTGIPFTPAQNRFIVDSNSWIEQACSKRSLSVTPCAEGAGRLYQDSDSVYDIGQRRVAIPLAELPWETERPGVRKHSRTGTGGKRLAEREGLEGAQWQSSLTIDQAAIRYTALMTVIQKIESLESVLKEFSGKNAEEWATWWANMMSNLLDQNGVASGESLEIGAFYATKKPR